jgi:hypothetical protein
VFLRLQDEEQQQSKPDRAAAAKPSDFERTACEAKEPLLSACSDSSLDSDAALLADTSSRLQGKALLVSQSRAICKKRLHVLRQEKRNFCLFLAVPLYNLAFALYLLNSFGAGAPTIEPKLLNFSSLTAYSSESIISSTASGNDHYTSSDVVSTSKPIRPCYASYDQSKAVNASAAPSSCLTSTLIAANGATRQLLLDMLAFQTPYLCDGTILEPNPTEDGQETLLSALLKRGSNAVAPSMLTSFVIGQSSDTLTMALLHNSSSVHVMPQSLLSFSNAFLRFKANGTQAPLFELSCSSQPLPFTSESPFSAFGDIMFVILLGMAFTLVPLASASQLHQDKESGLRALLFLAHLHPATYWLTNLFMDLLFGLFPVFLVLLCCAIAENAVGVEVVIMGSNFPLTTLLMLLHLLAGNSVMQVVGQAFSKLVTLQTTASVLLGLLPIGSFFGILAALALASKTVFHIVLYSLLAFPGTSFMWGLFALARQHNCSDLPGFLSCGEARADILLSICYLSASSVVFSGLAIILSGGKICKRQNKGVVPAPDVVLAVDEDADVSAERRRVEQSQEIEDTAVLRNITKTYKTGKYVVRSLFLTLCICMRLFIIYYLSIYLLTYVSIYLSIYLFL